MSLKSDDTTIFSADITKVVSIDSPKKMVMFEEMPNGEWRLTYTKSLLPVDANLTAVLVAALT